MYQNNPKFLKKLIIKELNEITQYSNNFLNSIESVIKSSKKDTIDNVIEILQDQISKQNEYYQIFKDIIVSSSTSSPLIFDFIPAFI